VDAALAPRPDARAIELLLAGAYDQPHAILGAHPAPIEGEPGAVVRAFHPDAVGVDLVLGDRALPMHTVERGLFAVALANVAPPFAYRLRFRFADGAAWERDDPYRFLPTLGEIDLHLFNEGTHRRLWEKLGSHPMIVDGVAGTSFAVWAPNARSASVYGDFCGWDTRLFPMRRLGASGVFELFVPDVGENAAYKYDLLARDGTRRRKTDPFAFEMRQAPTWNSVVRRLDGYAWGDEAWMAERSSRDLAREPMLVYEVHLGSWMRESDGEEGSRPLTYREIAPRLAAHAKGLGFTHVELLPIAEHPFGGSWGYQVAGYYAPTSRYGSPDDFRFFVDTMHRAGLGVILDWVPAHFPKDDWALRRFDGTALYEHEDPRLGEHPDWGTLIFNYGRLEVRNFLLANALFWLGEYHVDGLRVDAVASMLYLDYSRQPGQWLRNRLGGRENLDAIDFLRATNEAIREEQPGCFTVAEESTAWPKVTGPASEGGLGFEFKWNMGWMHDTLRYVEMDPVNRKWHHDLLTFGMIYEYSERFVMPLSHDEVVHLKGSLLAKMPGDPWRKFANLRLLLALQYTRPGKALVFMGTELAPWTEWNHDASLDWSLLHAPLHREFGAYVAELGALYHSSSAFWAHDHDPQGFGWIDVNDREQSVISYVRCDGDERRIVVLNFTPVPRESYRIGCPVAGEWALVFSSDDARYGGSGFEVPARVASDAAPYHGFAQSIEVALPPLAAIVLAPVATDDEAPDAGEASASIPDGSDHATRVEHHDSPDPGELPGPGPSVSAPQRP
jgi:1,4-alpha-glucan branching enzyme